ncbi:MAG: methionyl-tRNA formyltransferase [Nitrospira sp.]|nr:methionyl-tRNA formyltransferase [bacterium]MBL7049388.1 methionyl-tRNA formyltransferase [Nitrospira sp.]
MKIVFFGTPEFAVKPLLELIRSGHDVIAVVTQPDRRSGRGRQVTPCPVKEEALRAGLDVLQPLSVKAPEFLEELSQYDPEVIVVVAYGQLLPSAILNMPQYGCINIHASLLPKYRGAAPINWAIINGEKIAGVTTMRMDEGMDTGPSLLAREVAISEEDTTSSLAGKLSDAGAELMLVTLEGIVRGDVQEVPQTGDATYAPILKKSDGLIRWTDGAVQICNFIRGMQPWPAAYSFTGGVRYGFLRAVPADIYGGPGVILEITREKMIIGTGDAAISVIEIQPSGKAKMPIRAFLQGSKLKAGMKFSASPEV